MRHVDADPSSAEPVCGLDGSTAPAERIEDDIARIRARQDHSLEQRHWLLSRIPCALLANRGEHTYLPDVGERGSLCLLLHHAGLAMTRREVGALLLRSKRLE